MSAFTFEIVRNGETPVIADVLMLSEERAIWRQVEALALRIENPDGASIQVKDGKGETVIRAGVNTALASIEKCSCTSCPLKKGLDGRFSPGSRVAIELPIPFVPCGRQGGCSCKVSSQSQNFEALSLPGEVRQ
jgi:hypothetical protein